MNKELQALYTKNATDAARYVAIREIARIEFGVSHADFDLHADASIMAISEFLADNIAVSLMELDPTHMQGCCGKCAGNCPPENGWGPSDNG
jgi:hypothetical protein